MPDGIQASLYIWRRGLLRRPLFVPQQVPDTDKRETRKTPTTYVRRTQEPREPSYPNQLARVSAWSCLRGKSGFKRLAGPSTRFAQVKIIAHVIVSLLAH